MCDPITLSIAAAGAVIGGGASVAGGIGAIAAGAIGGAIAGTSLRYAAKGVTSAAKSMFGSDKSSTAPTSSATPASNYKSATYADSSVSKAGNAQRSSAAMLAAQNIRTPSQGLGGVANTTKKTALGS